MNKTKIEWCDQTWNPMTGCLHECKYCYARKIAKRFGGNDTYEHDRAENWTSNKQVHHLRHPAYFCRVNENEELIERNAPYPFGFEPTFHEYRLDEPTHIRKPSIIFVCSMADLFGEWVPAAWINQVCAACQNAPQHTYLFLTKNPGRFQDFDLMLPWPSKKMWFGFSVTDQKMLNTVAMQARYLPQMFISIEPLHGAIDLKHIHPDGVEATLDFTNGGQYWLMGGDKNGRKLTWVIIGAESGSREGKVVPKREWVERIIDDCKAEGVPVFMKDSLKDIWGAPLIQEWPEKMEVTP